MAWTPAALAELTARFRYEKRALSRAPDGAAHVATDYVEPLLELLGWDVHDTQQARGKHLPVEQLTIPQAAGAPPLRAYLLNEQSYRYYRHHLLGVCAPPLRHYTAQMLAELGQALRRSPVLIETLALTDFASLRFYDNTPGSPYEPAPTRARLYTLPCWQYPAWWGGLRFPLALLHNKHKFNLYASKLRIWGGLPTRDDE